MRIHPVNAVSAVSGTVSPNAPLVALRPSGAVTAARAAPHPRDEVFRLTDTVVVVSVLFTAFIYTNRHSIQGLEQFLAMRVSMKNLLLFSLFIVLWQLIYTAGTHLVRDLGGGVRSEAIGVVATCTLAAAAAATVPLSGLSSGFGLPAVALFWLVAPAALLVTRSGARRLAQAARWSARPQQVVIVGSGPRAYAAYRRIHGEPETGYQVLGFVDTNDRIGIPAVRAQHLGELHDLELLLMHRNVDLVLIALPVKSRYVEIQESIRVCERVGVESRYLADVFDAGRARHGYAPAGSMPAMALTVVHDDVRIHVKRALDVAVAAAGILLLLPLFLGIALAVRLSSPGPVFFAQERYGFNRRIFRMFKFRTMVTNAEALQFSLEHLNEASGPVFKIRDDPRVTAFGRLLRRTSLDELPQLFNVLLGDMSLVGPRPLPVRDVRHFSEAALMRRFSVVPGLTCLWQISGRSNVGFDDWVKLDLEYIDTWSLWLDLKVLLRTLPAVVRGVGAS